MQRTLQTLKKNRETVSIYKSEKETMDTMLLMKIKDVQQTVKNEEQRVKNEMEKADKKQGYEGKRLNE